MLVGRPLRKRSMKKSGPLRAMSRPYDARSGSGRRTSREPRRSSPPRSNATPVMRRGDEHHAADLRPGPEDQGGAEQVAVGLVARQVFNGAIADEPPQPGPALLDHHLGQQAAHAMADEDHPVEGRIRAIGVELPPHLIQVATQQRGRIGQRIARRIAVGPELIPVAEGRVGLQLLDHPVPGPRVRPQSVDQDHGDPTAPVGSQEREPRRLVPEEVRDVRIRPWRRAALRLPRWFDARRNLGPGPCRRDDCRDRD